VNKIKLLCVLASAAGLKEVQSEYPDLEVRVAWRWFKLEFTYNP
jgi:uracil phosphoribosyltransferase